MTLNQSWVKPLLANSLSAFQEQGKTIEKDVLAGWMTNIAQPLLETGPLIVTLYEGGFRVGEVLGLKVKHVSFDNNRAKIAVEGKTGM
jgi:integrase